MYCSMSLVLPDRRFFVSFQEFDREGRSKDGREDNNAIEFELAYFRLGVWRILSPELIMLVLCLRKFFENISQFVPTGS